MGLYTTWFIADEEAAADIASTVTTEELNEYDWPNLTLKNVGQFEFMALNGVLRGEPGQLVNVAGDLLHQEDDSLYVYSVRGEFIEALAAVGPGDLDRVAEAWGRTEQMAGWDHGLIGRTLDELMGFARSARAAGKPVLELTTV